MNGDVDRSPEFFRSSSSLYEIFGFFFAIYKIPLYPLVDNEKKFVLFLVMNIFLLESLFWRFFLLAYGSVFGSRIGYNGYNTRVSMGFHRFG